MRTAPDRLTGACIDCGEPVRHDVLRCRKCYLVERRRGKALEDLASQGRVRKPRLVAQPVVDGDDSGFAKMDAKFCAAMRGAHPGLERR